MAGMAGLQTQHRYGNATMLADDFVFGIGNRWANRHTGSIGLYTRERKSVHVDIEPNQIGRFLRSRPGHRVGCQGRAADARGSGEQAAERGPAPDFSAWAEACHERKRTMLRRTDYDNAPIKPQRVYAEMNKAFGDDMCYVAHRPVADRGREFLSVQKPRHSINCGTGGAARMDPAGALGMCVADPHRTVVAISATTTSSS